MIKQLTMLAVAAGMFMGAGSLQAQCQKGAKECAAKPCCATKKGGATLSELKEINKDQVASFVTANNATIVDARDAESYAAGHINGAVNFGTAVLPADKNAPIVFYCGGLKCPMAAKAAKQAIENGYKNVMVFRGGWAEWSKSQS